VHHPAPPGPLRPLEVIAWSAAAVFPQANKQRANDDSCGGVRRHYTLAALGNVVLPQLQAAAQKLEPLGGRVDIRQFGRTGKMLRPTSVAFRIMDQQGGKSRAYLIVPRGGTVTVTCGDGFDIKTGHPQQPENIGEKVGIQQRDDLTIENVKKLILGAIAEYRNDRNAPSTRMTTVI
jgi:hypothetical protein